MPIKHGGEWLYFEKEVADLVEQGRKEGKLEELEKCILALHHYKGISYSDAIEILEAKLKMKKELIKDENL